MTVNAARRTRRRAGAPPPTPLPAPVESLAIGEINQTVFDCPKCARPLAMGARRCPRCGTRLVLGVPMAKASVIASFGLAVGLVLGAVGGMVFGMTRLSGIALPGPAAVAPSAAPAGALTNPTVAPTTATPAPPSPSAGNVQTEMPSLTRSALAQAITVNDRLTAAAATLKTALAAKSFDASEVAQILRTISADSVYGEQLAGRVSSWSGSATLGDDLATAYGSIHDVAAEGLVASVQDVPAYRQTGRAMLTLLAGLGAIDAQVRVVAEANEVVIPSAPPAP